MLLSQKRGVYHENVHLCLWFLIHIDSPDRADFVGILFYFLSHQLLYKTSCDQITSPLHAIYIVKNPLQPPKTPTIRETIGL